MQRRANLPSLTGLRYLAAALVLVHHAAPIFSFGSVLHLFSNIGYIGVAFFFVLSGFVLTWSRTESLPKRLFYRRRFARIYPLHAATWVVAMFVSAYVGYEQSVAGGLASLLLVQTWFLDPLIYAGGNPPAWSLACEAFFYALFPFLLSDPLRLAERAAWFKPLLVIFVIFGVLYGASDSYSHWVAYVSPIYNLASFVIGILLAAYVMQGRKLRFGTKTATAFAVVTYFIASLPSAFMHRGLANALMLPAIVFLIGAFATADINHRPTFWSRATLVKLGQWSFALYLLHFMPLMVIEHWLVSPLSPGELEGAGLVGAYGLVLTTAAGICFMVFERPLERRLRGSRSKDVAPVGVGPTAAELRGVE